MTSSCLLLKSWIFVVLIYTTWAAEHLNDLGCSDGSTEEFFYHKSIQACSGTWQGHVNSSGHLCAPGWQVCSWQDHSILKTITFKEAMAVPGCYAINAAQDGGLCGQCTSDLEKDDLAGIGSDCPHQDGYQESCITGGRIDVSCCVDTHHQRACTHKPGISTGILCCKVPGTVPKFVMRPPRRVTVMPGMIISLSCQVSGVPQPTVQWLKDGSPMQEDPRIMFMKSGDILITLARWTDSGRYTCIASNPSHTISAQSSVNVLDSESGCADQRTEGLHHFLNVQACAGRWEGHVTNAQPLCSEGWSVCNPAHVNILKWVRWYDSNHLEGCYAYNAANTHNRCTRCINENLAGLGSGCLRHRRNPIRHSCLMYGRIDVFSTRLKSSCNYQDGLTRGVLCCRNHDPVEKAKVNKKSRCKPLCANGGKCLENGKCSCAINYSGSWCQNKIVKTNNLVIKKECYKNRHCSCHGNAKCLEKRKHYSMCKHFCLNGGRCKLGKCWCPKSYWGKFCHLKIDSYWFSKARKLQH